MPDHTSLKGFSDIGESLLSEQLEANLVTWLDWGLLGKGAYFDVRIPASGAYGGGLHLLAPATDHGYEAGQVWQGVRNNWVWQTGIEYGQQPLRASGVVVDGVFHPTTGVGPYSHHIDFPLGRVVFASSVPVTAVVACEHSVKYVAVAPGSTPWWRQLQADSFRADDPHFTQQGSGVWALLSQNRVQLPAVVVDVRPNTTRSGLQLGGGVVVRQDVLLHVVAETPVECSRLHDVLTYQHGKRLVLFDVNRLADEGRHPLDANGSPAPSGLMYPDLVRPTGEGGVGWRQLRLTDAASTEQPRERTAPYSVATVRLRAEVDMPV